MNKQREAVYGLRKQLMEGVDQKELITEDYVCGHSLATFSTRFAPEKSIRTSGTWTASTQKLIEHFGLQLQRPEAIDVRRR